MHKFSDFPGSSELSFLNFLVLENIQYSDPPIHIWISYLGLYCYILYDYFLGLVNWKMDLISCLPFHFYVA